MTDVYHHVRSEIAANRSRFSFSRIGRSEHSANFADHVICFEDHSDHWRGLHEFNDAWEERLISHVAVVVFQLFAGKTNHFGAADGESSFLKTIENCAAVFFLHAIWFEEDE